MHHDYRIAAPQYHGLFHVQVFFSHNPFSTSHIAIFHANRQWFPNSQSFQKPHLIQILSVHYWHIPSLAEHVLLKFKESGHVALALYPKNK